MAENKPKKKSHQGASTINTELINVRFYENQKRQALLTTTVDEDDVEESTDDVELSSVAISTTQSVCDTVVDTLKNPSPPPSSGDAVSVDDSSTPSTSSLAISAPSDKSRKGSVDKKIWNLVNLINRETDAFFTTSSCSGRIILYTWDVGYEDETHASSSSKLKKGCKWLLVSHDEVRPEELVNTYSSTAAESASSNQKDENAPHGERDVYFKMEPCILHVQCRTLTNARKLIHIATESGFRNSGMIIGKENRITVAIRSAIGLEVPLPPASKSSQARQRQQNESLENRELQVDDEYLKYLVNIANTKMRENWSRSEKLTTLFAEASWQT